MSSVLRSSGPRIAVADAQSERWRAAEPAALNNSLAHAASAPYGSHIRRLLVGRFVFESRGQNRRSLERSRQSAQRKTWKNSPGLILLA